MTDVRAVEAGAADPIHGEPPAPAVYADVTAGGPRPILPAWLASRDAACHHARRVAGREWHRLRFHAIRLPWYAAAAAFWSVVGLGWGLWELVHWWLFPVPMEAHASAAAEGWRAWKSLHTQHRQTTRVRAIILAAVTVGGVWAGELAWLYARWALAVAAAVVLVAAARFGRPDGRRITTPARVPGAYEDLTQDVIARALGSLGLAGIDRWVREGKAIVFPHPVRQDGPGWRAEVDLPYGVTATQVIERREQLASGLRRPLGAVWPEPVTSEHAGRLELWVGQQDISRAKAPAWPLLRTGQADVFRGLPFGVDVRGRKVSGPIAYHNWLIGSIPRQGKTAAVRVLACGIALDPLAELWVHELKGTGDLDPLEPLCPRFTSGIREENMEYAAASLALLRAECERRGPLIRSLPPALCPERRVTREISQRYRQLRPVVVITDECQNLFLSSHGKQAAEDAEFVIKVGPAMGIWLILATQRPDKDSLPKGISANVSIRFCLKVMGQVENDMVLGTSAYKNGIRATTFRPVVDAGTGYLISDAPAPRVCKTYFLDVPASRSVVARARVLRERAGTLPVATEAAQERDVLADVLAVVGGDPGVHWEALAGRLAQRFPDRWADVTAEALSAQLRALGVPSVTVSVGGQKARGCRKDAIEAVAR